MTSDQRRFSWRDPKFTYADALTGARLIMLPYLIYALVTRLAGVAVVTLLVMIATDLIDGRVARRLRQSRAFGGAFDSGIDFIVIYSLFTAFSRLACCRGGSGSSSSRPRCSWR